MIDIYVRNQHKFISSEMKVSLTIPTEDRNSALKTSASDYKINTERNRIIQLETFARRLDRRLYLEKKIVDQVRTFQTLENEIKKE